MQNRICSSAASIHRNLSAVDESFRKRNCSYIFHGSRIEIRDNDLIIFRKWVREAELSSKKLQTLLSDPEPFIMIYIFRQRFSREQANGYSVGIALPGCVGAGVKRKDIGTEYGRRWKCPTFPPIDESCLPLDSI